VLGISRYWHLRWAARGRTDAGAKAAAEAAAAKAIAALNICGVHGTLSLKNEILRSENASGVMFFLFDFLAFTSLPERLFAFLSL
jgi:hypothetical protein